MVYNEGRKITCPVFPVSLQSTSGMTQVGLHPQGVRLLRSSAVPQASSDVFAFPQACSLEQNFTVDDVNTPKVGPIFDCEIRNIHMSRMTTLSTCQGADDLLPYVRTQPALVSKAAQLPILSSL